TSCMRCSTRGSAGRRCGCGAPPRRPSLQSSAENASGPLARAACAPDAPAGAPRAGSASPDVRRADATGSGADAGTCLPSSRALAGENEQAKAVLGKSTGNSLAKRRRRPVGRLRKGRAAASWLARGAPGEDEHERVGGGVVHRRLTTLDKRRTRRKREM